jgi:TonB family protein
MRHGANKFFLIAMLLSVVAHVVVASLGQRYISLPAWTATNTSLEEMTVVLEDPHEEEAPKAPELDPELKLGDAAGTGYASFAAEGLREQLARLADNDQAFLSLDPRGSGPGGDSAARQTDFTNIPTRPVAPAEARQATAAPPTPPNAPLFGVVSDNPAPKLVRDTRQVQAAPQLDPVRPEKARTEMTVDQSGSVKADAPDDAPSQVSAIVPLVPTDAKTAPPKPAAEPSPPAPPQPPAPPTPAGQPARSADPAPKSDSEVDPFSSIGSVEFREGNLAVRAGRKIKPRRPKLTLAGNVSVFQMQGARVVLAVSTDASGKVTNAEIVKSSGTVDIDQPTRVAMYDWWFEPKKDASGQPVPDRFMFEIVFH